MAVTTLENAPLLPPLPPLVATAVADSRADGECAACARRRRVAELGASGSAVGGWRAGDAGGGSSACLTSAAAAGAASWRRGRASFSSSAMGCWLARKLQTAEWFSSEG